MTAILIASGFALLAVLAGVVIYALFSMSAMQAQDEPIESIGVGAGDLRCFGAADMGDEA